MDAVDTNLLLHFLLNDDSEQSPAVRNFFTKLVTLDERVFVTWTCVLELIWVLRSACRMKRGEIVHVIAELGSMPCLAFDGDAVLAEFVRIACETNIELDDLLIGLTGVNHGCRTTLTFDLAAAKFELFTAFP